MLSANQHKIIFTGPVGAGKTTAIRTISDIEPVCTEELATDEVAMRKSETTVAMDYGMMMLDDKECIHLYGTPGQKRFDFMWQILSDGGIGLIIVVDNAAPNPIKEMCEYISAFEDFIKDHKFSVGINFTNKYLQAAPSINDYCKALDKLGLKAPVFEVDCRRMEDVSMLVQSLIYSCDPWLGRETQ